MSERVRDPPCRDAPHGMYEAAGCDIIMKKEKDISVMKIVVGYDGGLRARVTAAVLREQGNEVSAAYVTKDGLLPERIRRQAADDGLLITEVYGDGESSEGIVSALCGYMKVYGFGAVATGHIARVSREEKETVSENGETKTVIHENGVPRVACALDAGADESRKLGLVPGELVCKLRLPLGDMKPGELDTYAASKGIEGETAKSDAAPSDSDSAASFRLTGLVFQRGEAPNPAGGAAMHYCHVPVRVGTAAPVESHVYLHQLAGFGITADIIFITGRSYARAGEVAVVYDADGNIMFGGRISAVLD